MHVGEKACLLVDVAGLTAAAPAAVIEQAPAWQIGA
jgi:hypothetical protein